MLVMLDTTFPVDFVWLQVLPAHQDNLGIMEFVMVHAH